MKISAFVINILLTLLAIGAVVFECVVNVVRLPYAISFLKIFVGIEVLIICGYNLFVKIYKKSNTLVFDILITSAVLLSLLSRYVIVGTYVLGLLLLIVAQILIVVAMTKAQGFKMNEVVFAIAIFLPIFFVLIFSSMFGFGSAGTEILSMIFWCAISYSLSKSICMFIKKKTASNILLLVANILFVIFGTCITMMLFSNVTWIVDYVTYTSLILSLGLYELSMVLYKSSEREPKGNADRVASYMRKSVAVLLTSMMVCYALVMSSSMFTLATAKVRKDEFLELMGDDFNLPIIEINTEHNALPVNKTDYINCSFKLSNCENQEYDLSVDMADNYGDENSVGIRLRGNSTKNSPKRPYRIKFDKKKSILGLEKNKSWVLLADYCDQSSIKNYATFVLADSFDNMNFSPTPNHVALILNNEFKGLYLLCEQMDENKGRADVKDDFDISVDREFPFLVEMDNAAHKEGITGVDNFQVPSVSNFVEIKFPEADERQVTDANDPVNVSFRNFPVELKDLVNIDSAVDYYLINEIMLNYDNGSKSIYFHKTKDGLMEFGPIWDFDQSMQTNFQNTVSESFIDTASTIHLGKTSAIYRALLNNPDFYNKVVARYDELKSNILEVVEHLSVYKDKINDIALLDAKMWYGYTGEYEFDTQYDFVRLYLKDRYDFLTTAFSKTQSEFVSTYL